MPITVSQQLGITRAEFDKTGAFDTVLDLDSRLFIHPQLLRKTAAPYMKTSYGRVTKAFADILTVLKASKKPGDVFWRKADDLLTFPEVQGLCIGYSMKGTAGSGMGSGLRANMLQTAKEIIDAGIEDPAIFELMGLLEEGIGADRISDMIGRIIMPDLLAFSANIFKKLGVETETCTLGSSAKKYELVSNPYNGLPITLVPRDVLRDLPVARSWDDIEAMVGFNQQLRNLLNQLIGAEWKKRARRRPPPKPVIKSTLIKNPSLLEKLLAAYQDMGLIPYDFTGDPRAFVVPVLVGAELTKQFPAQVKLKSNPSADDVLDVVLKISLHLKDLIENNGQNALLYNDPPKNTGGKTASVPKHEAAAQNVFFMIADAYCRANDLDLSPEVDSGRGAVDFKVSKGYNGRVLVETKLTTNTQLIHGFVKQLGEYQKAEKTEHSVYVVFDVQGGSGARLQKLRNIAKAAIAAGKRVPRIVEIDARFKKSASKY